MEKRYNKKYKTYIHLNEGENFCPNCKGCGLDISIDYYRGFIVLTCSTCLGKGKIDWVEKVVGVNSNEIT